jgi:DNA-binding CsgD family transcriptional regulator
MPSSNDTPASTDHTIPSKQQNAGDREGTVSGIVRDLASPASSTRRANAGGPSAHKNPNCKCHACASRRRKEEALARGDRPPIDPEAKYREREKALNADLPVLHTGPTALRRRVAEYVEQRAINPSLTSAEIARRMGIAPKTLYSYISRATKNGWLTFDDPIERLDNEIIPKVLDNLNEFLDQKDRTVTIEAAKGTLFPAYKETKGINEAQRNTVLAIKFELPSGETGFPGRLQDSSSEHLPVINGTIVGQPKLPPRDDNGIPPSDTKP